MSESGLRSRTLAETPAGVCGRVAAGRPRRPKQPREIDLAEIAGLVPEGCVCAPGGGWLSSRPMAAMRELVRARRRVEVLTVLGGLDVDLLCAAGIVRSVTYSFVSLDAYGTARCFRRSVESGTVTAHEHTGFELIVGIEAAARAVPSLRTIAPDGDTVEVPALRPEVAIIHAACVDPDGNVGLTAAPFVDVQLAHAAEVVIVTAERRCADLDSCGRLTATIPRFLVDAVAIAELGAHPTSAEPAYSADPWALAGWARDPTGCAERWISAGHDYPQLIGGERLEALRG